MQDNHLTQQELATLFQGSGVEGVDTGDLIVCESIRNDVLSIKITKRVFGMMDGSTLVSRLSKIIEGTQRHIILDLTGCTYLSSFALGALTYFANKQQKAGWRLSITGANETIRALFELTNTNNLIPMFETQTEALSAME